MTGVAAAPKSKPLRTLVEPFVVKPPTGVSTRTRVHGDPGTLAALAQVGEYLGGVYRGLLVSRLDLGDVDYVGDWWAASKNAVTADTSSRWAGALTTRVMEQYDLGLRALEDQVATLEDIISKISSRLAVPVGTRAGRVAGYKDETEAFSKSRRLSATRGRLVKAKARLTVERPRVVVGGSSLLRNRANLAAAGLDETTWREAWQARRMFLYAAGEPTRYGNQTITVIPNESTPGRAKLRVRVPHALEPKYGKYLWLEVSTGTHLSEVWLDRVGAGLAVAYRIFYDPVKGRWYLDVSWQHGKAKQSGDGTTAKSSRGVKGAKRARKVQTPTVDQLDAAIRVGVDLNDGHLATMVVDQSGNPVGAPLDIPLPLAGLPATTRDAYVRHAVTTLVKHALDVGAGVIVIEDLGFEDSRRTGRETMGRGKRGKRFRRTVAGIPTAKFRARLVAAATRAGLWVVAVDPAYTSKWSREHWLTPLQAVPKTSMVTSHNVAGLAVARRSLRLTLRRKVEGPRGRRSIAPGQSAVVAATPGNSARVSSLVRNRSPERPQSEGPRQADLGSLQHRSGDKSVEGSVKDLRV